MAKKPLPQPLDAKEVSLLTGGKLGVESPIKHLSIIHRLSACGMDNGQIAQFLGIEKAQLTAWANKYQAIRRALETARMERDFKVVDALYQRATGYEHDHEDIKAVAGEIVITPTTKHVAPDVKAQEIWLYNRMPDKWKSRSAIELTGKDGGPVEQVTLTPEQALKVKEEIAQSLGLASPPSQLDALEVRGTDDND